jgi:archaellum component FlaG (FlaF/FlaG flagellin family)
LDKTIVTAFMVIISIVASVTVFNSLYPAIQQSSDAMVNMKSRLDDQLKSQVEVVHASGELNSSGAWQDANGDGRFNVFIWTKNIGSSRISGLERVDVFFGPEGDFARIPHQSNSGGTFPYWTATVVNDTDWNPTATLEITIHFGGTLASGRYFIKIITPNGAEDEYFMGL